MANKISNISPFCSTQVTCFLSPDGDFLFVEAGMEVVLGFLPEEMLGKNLRTFLHPDDNQVLRSCSLQQNPSPFPVRIKTRAGKYVRVELKLEAKGDLEGKIHSLAAKLYSLDSYPLIKEADINTPSAALFGSGPKASLMESEKLYRSLFQNHPDLVLITDPNGVILRSNKNSLATKFSSDLVLTDKNFLQYLSEAGRRLVSSKLPDLLTGHTVQLEARLEYVPRPFMGLITIVPFEEEGLFTGFFVKVRNISDRVKAEEALQLSNERYRLATKATHDAVLDWDLSSNMIYLGDGYNTLFGYDFPSSIGVDQWIKYVHPDDSKNVVEALFERISANTNWSIEYRYKCADGTYKFIRDRACVIHNKYNRAIRVTGAMSDITEQKKNEELLKEFNSELEVKVYEKTSILEDALRRMREEMEARAEADEILKQSVKEKEVLLKEIHHRVKNNMAVISGLLSLQARQAKQEEVKDLFKDSQSRIKSMALVHEHLYQNRNLSSINFKGYIQELVSGISQSFHHHTYQIKILVKADDLELDITHAVPCGLILNELITNAYKYAFKKEQKGKIEIEFSKKKEQFVLRIADNGSGFPVELCMKNPRTLGLKLVGNLVKQIGGTLDAQNYLGTKFIITFPQKV